MKKLLIGALALAVVAGAVPAQAQVSGGITVTLGRPSYDNNYGYDNRYGYNNDSYRYNRGHRYDRTRRGNEYLYYRYFQRQPSAYGNQCGVRWDVLVRDPYTGRLVCMDRSEYERYTYEVRNRF